MNVVSGATPVLIKLINAHDNVQKLITIFSPDKRRREAKRARRREMEATFVSRRIISCHAASGLRAGSKLARNKLTEEIGYEKANWT